MTCPFLRHGPTLPDSPVIISVPHAGRAYPAGLRALLRVPHGSLAGLEDRHLDAVALAAHGAESMLVQQVPRAWIDLNRAETERDPRIDAGAVASRSPSAKLRSGLGLIPRRAPGVGDIWARRLCDAEARARIDTAHRPYHVALAALLAAARARFGIAILLDVHSMPPLGDDQPQVVLGDRFGHAAGARFVHRMEAVLHGAGHRVGINTPYAGGHILERHADPAAGIHGVQLELDRTLYLDARLDRPGAGLAMTARLVRQLIDALHDEALAGSGCSRPNDPHKKPPRAKRTRWPRFREETR